MRNKPFLLCFCLCFDFLLNILSLLLLTKKQWLLFFYCFSVSQGGKVIQIFAKGRFLIQLESGEIGVKVALLENLGEMRCPPFEGPFLCSD